MNSEPLIGWLDLTVENADETSSFYEKVIGWSRDTFDMGGYNDYNMKKPSGDIAGGICHAKGGNKSIPPMWIPYFTVANVKESLKIMEENGGELLNGPKTMTEGTYAIIKDPAGACCALWQAAEK